MSVHTFMEMFLFTNFYVLYYRSVCKNLKIIIMLIFHIWSVTKFVCVHLDTVLSVKIPSVTVENICENTNKESVISVIERIHS